MMFPNGKTQFGAAGLQEFEVEWMGFIRS